MTQRWIDEAQRSPLTFVPIVTLLALLACGDSSDAGPDEPAPPLPDDGGPSESSEDAGADAADAEPPPYDFEVACVDGSVCVARIAARGGAHACAVLRDGSVSCWGANASGQLGTAAEDRASIPAYAANPRAVLGVTNATSVAATGDGPSGTTCVVTDSHTVSCFGSDAWGPLGRGSGSQDVNPDPFPVEGLEANAMTLTGTFALAIGMDGRLLSWGTNDKRQLGRSDVDAGVFGAVGQADRVTFAVRSCAGTAETGFVVTTDGALLSWGAAVPSPLGRPFSAPLDPMPGRIALSDVSTVATGAGHACALHRGRVDCWGDNDHGQLGTGGKAEEVLPAPVALPSDVYAVAVAAGARNSCIIASDGVVYCWGANRSGQLGTPVGTDRPLPVRIGELHEPAVSVGVMDNAICALLRSGVVACWGDNVAGQLGRGSRDAEVHTEPKPVLFD